MKEGSQVIEHPVRERALLVGALILLAAFARLVPHAPNFTPIGAMALFGGSHFRRPVVAILVVFAAMFLSDLFLGVDASSLAVYLSLAAIVLLGFFLRSGESILRGVTSCFLSASLFFIVTNFAVWMGSLMYPITLKGLVACYTLAIPFFWNTLLGDLSYFAAMTLCSSLVVSLWRKVVTA